MIPCVFEMHPRVTPQELDDLLKLRRSEGFKTISVMVEGRPEKSYPISDLPYCLGLTCQITFST